MEGHRIILNDLLDLVKRENITSILDAGSGRTSLSIIANAFPNTSIENDDLLIGFKRIFNDFYSYIQSDV